MKSIDLNGFIAADTAFIDMHGKAADLDPLRVHQDGLIKDLQSTDPGSRVRATSDVFERADHWIQTYPGTNLPALTAVRRDLDKATGSAVQRKQDIIAEIPASRSVFDFLIGHDGNPRASFYEYVLAAPPADGFTYTGERNERALLDLFRDSIVSAHYGVYGLLRARDALSRGDTASATEPLTQAFDSAITMQRHMVSAYREVGPEFVAQRLTRYLGPIKHGAENFEGPNPSHSGFITFDRLVVGSVARLLQPRPALAEQFAYRQHDLPGHHTELLDDLEMHEAASIVELTQGTKLHETAQKITVALRKQKVVHQSYADKGLRAKNKQLTADEPDVLSDTINFIRTKEK